jgi:hypothetical protein
MLKVPSTISRIVTMADGGLRLHVDTQELTASDKAVLMNLYNQLGYFVFAPANEMITDKDIPTEQLEPSEKSPSQRLRGVLWILHEKKGGKPEDFEVFYRRYLEKIISKLKDTISQLE